MCPFPAPGTVLGTEDSGLSQGHAPGGQPSPKSTCIYLFIHSFIHSFIYFRAIPTAYVSSQARGRMGAAAASLHHSHSNKGSKPGLQPTPQLTAMPDP